MLPAATGGRVSLLRCQADVVFETAGSPKTASMTVDVLARGGKIVMVGNVPGKTENGIIDIELKKAVGAAEMEISVTKP